MDKGIDNLKLLNFLQCVSAPRRDYRDRPSHALVFRRSGDTAYDFGGRHMLIEEGQIIFLPKGTSFSVTQLTPGVSRYTVINFQGPFFLEKPQKLCLEGDRTKLYDLLDRSCMLDRQQDRFQLMANFYMILSLLLEAGKNAYHSRDSMRLLEPALVRLQERIFDPMLKVGQLHRLCGISDTYFRTLFVARFGTVPKKYVLSRRLEQGKNLLQSGECGSVAEAARLSGFTDALYFSKVFKSHYGVPPSAL